MEKTNSKIIAGAAALTAIIAVVGIAASTYAHWGDKSDSQEFSRGRKGFLENRDAINNALVNRDFTAWKDLIAGTPLADKISGITQEDFEKLAQIQELIKTGKIDEAKKLKEELNIDYGPIMGFGRGMMKNGRGLHAFIDNNGDGVCDYKKE